MRIKPIILFLLSTILVLPFVVLPFLSLVKGYRFPQLWPDDFTITHWLSLFAQRSDLGRSVGLSALLSFSVALVVTSLGFFTSRHIAYSPFKNRWLSMAYFPFILSPVVYGALLLYYFINFNLNGQLLGVIISQVLLIYPFTVILFTNFWDHRLKAFEELSVTLGGTQWQTFYKVLLPLAKKIILLCFFQSFLLSWFEYGLTSIIGLGKVETLTIKVFYFIGEANIYLAALASCLLILPPVLMLYFNKKWVLR